MCLLISILQHVCYTHSRTHTHTYIQSHMHTWVCVLHTWVCVLHTFSHSCMRSILCLLINRHIYHSRKPVWDQYLSIFINIYQYSSIFINIHQYSSIFINIYQYLSIFINIYQYLSIFINIDSMQVYIDWCRY